MKAGRVIFRKRWEKMQRKDMRQSMPVLHLKQGGAAKSYCLNTENYFDKQTVYYYNVNGHPFYRMLLLSEYFIPYQAGGVPQM
jgi:hypothetical protein